MELKLDNQVMQMELLEKKSEKKNKQLLLHKIVQQLEEFKDDLISKFNSISIDSNHQQQQQSKSTSTSATPPPPSIPLIRTTNPATTTTTTTISINKGKNVPMDLEQLMELTDV
ncbi:unnamed protein product [Rotaria sordida]|uniref:Uncharacterized protein n=1 Tax=Rotaria sordida TaxID=392033 RepID=A0A819NJN6_9BILA|nr:unnamed protein product [Rotaria sordida]